MQQHLRFDSLNIPSHQKGASLPHIKVSRSNDTLLSQKQLGSIPSSLSQTKYTTKAGWHHSKKGTLLSFTSQQQLLSPIADDSITDIAPNGLVGSFYNYKSMYKINDSMTHKKNLTITNISKEASSILDSTFLPNTTSKGMLKQFRRKLQNIVDQKKENHRISILKRDPRNFLPSYNSITQLGTSKSTNEMKEQLKNKFKQLLHELSGYIRQQCTLPDDLNNQKVLVTLTRMKEEFQAVSEDYNDYYGTKQDGLDPNEYIRYLTSIIDELKQERPLKQSFSLFEEFINDRLYRSLSASSHRGEADPDQEQQQQPEFTIPIPVPPPLPPPPPPPREVKMPAKTLVNQRRPKVPKEPNVRQSLKNIASKEQKQKRVSNFNSSSVASSNHSRRSSKFSQKEHSKHGSPARQTQHPQIQEIQQSSDSSSSSNSQSASPPQIRYIRSSIQPVFKQQHQHSAQPRLTISTFNNKPSTITQFEEPREQSKQKEAKEEIIPNTQVIPKVKERKQIVKDMRKSLIVDSPDGRVSEAYSPMRSPMRSPFRRQTTQTLDSILMPRVGKKRSTQIDLQPIPDDTVLEGLKQQQSKLRMTLSMVKVEEGEQPNLLDQLVSCENIYAFNLGPYRIAYQDRRTPQLKKWIEDIDSILADELILLV